MAKLQVIVPPFPTGKTGSFVSSNREDNPIQLTYLIDKSKNNMLFGEVYFKPKSEGPPGHVHGGCQAAVLDEMMGSCCWVQKHPVVAKKIEVEFLQMVPVKSKYNLIAEITKIEGKKCFVEAKLFSGDKVFAKSSGLFIILDDKKLQELKRLI